jgi:hypothetical protein
LKARFAGPRRFYENLKELHLPKMRTIGAPTGTRSLRGGTNRDRHACHGTARRARRCVNAPFTMQRMIHHSTRHSPSCANGDGDPGESCGSAGENTGSRPALAFV